MDKPPPLAKIRQDLKTTLATTPKGSDLYRGLARAVQAIERAESRRLDKSEKPC
jgi:hypothetical protein